MSANISRLRYWRKTQNLTQTALGEMIGTTPHAVSRYESGERDMSYDQARILQKKSGGYLTGSNYREPVNPETGEPVARVQA